MSSKFSSTPPFFLYLPSSLGVRIIHTYLSRPSGGRGRGRAARAVLTISANSSVYNTIYKAFEANAAAREQEGQDADPVEAKKGEMLSKMMKHQFHDDFPNKGRDVFHEHYERVRQLVPADNLLEFRVQDGWEPLCKFLGVPVPEGELPRLNDTVAFMNNLEKQSR